MDTVRFLQIDDDPLIGKAVQKLARSCGYEARMTHDIASFKSEYDSFRPHLIMLDLAMPGFDGVELLRYLADLGCAAKLLIVSGLDQKVLDAAARLAKARGLSIAGTFTKPVQPAALRQALTQLRDEAAFHG
jgi:DNA-binding response OmpR family regulator